MGLKRTDEFRQDAVRIAQTSGLTRKQVADDLGVGMSTLNKWIMAYRDTDIHPAIRDRTEVLCTVQHIRYGRIA
jgi:transposase